MPEAVSNSEVSNQGAASAGNSPLSLPNVPKNQRTNYLLAAYLSVKTQLFLTLQSVQVQSKSLQQSISCNQNLDMQEQNVHYPTIDPERLEKRRYAYVPDWSGHTVGKYVKYYFKKNPLTQKSATAQEKIMNEFQSKNEQIEAIRASLSSRVSAISQTEQILQTGLACAVQTSLQSEGAGTGFMGAIETSAQYIISIG